MAFNQVSSTSLTPSRPAPPAPQRAGPGATYNPAFSIPSSSGSYSGIGGSPNRNSENIMNAHVVRNGIVSIKEDGFATSWLWRPKWLVLKEQTLSIHKSEVSLTYRSTLPPISQFAWSLLNSIFVLSRPAQRLVPSIFETSQTLSGSTSNPTAFFLRQRINDSTYLSRTMKNYTVGKMTSTLAALSWASVTRPTSFIKYT